MKFRFKAFYEKLYKKCIFRMKKNAFFEAKPNYQAIIKSRLQVRFSLKKSKFAVLKRKEMRKIQYNKRFKSNFPQ